MARSFLWTFSTWVNAAYRKAHPEKIAALEANASKEIRSYDVFYTVADLMGITWPGAATERSFPSKRFVPDGTKEHLVRGAFTARPLFRLVPLLACRRRD